MSETQKATDVAKLSFEEALEELRAIVAALEKGEGRLDQAIGSYERGIALKRHCEAKLKEAEAKLEQITLNTDGSVGTRPMDQD